MEVTTSPWYMREKTSEKNIIFKPWLEEHLTTGKTVVIFI